MGLQGGFALSRQQAEFGPVLHLMFGPSAYVPVCHCVLSSLNGFKPCWTPLGYWSRNGKPNAGARRPIMGFMAVPLAV